MVRIPGDAIEGVNRQVDESYEGVPNPGDGMWNHPDDTPGQPGSNYDDPNEGIVEPASFPGEHVNDPLTRTRSEEFRTPEREDKNLLDNDAYNDAVWNAPESERMPAPGSPDSIDTPADQGPAFPTAPEKAKMMLKERPDTRDQFEEIYGREQADKVFAEPGTEADRIINDDRLPQAEAEKARLEAIDKREKERDESSTSLFQDVMDFTGLSAFRPVSPDDKRTPLEIDVARDTEALELYDKKIQSIDKQIAESEEGSVRRIWLEATKAGYEFWRARTKARRDVAAHTLGILKGTEVPTQSFWGTYGKFDPDPEKAKEYGKSEMEEAKGWIEFYSNNLKNAKDRLAENQERLQKTPDDTKLQFDIWVNKTSIDVWTGLLQKQRARYDHGHELATTGKGGPKHAWWRNFADAAAHRVMDSAAFIAKQAGQTQSLISHGDMSQAKKTVFYSMAQYIEGVAEQAFPEDEARRFEFATMLADGTGSLVAVLGPATAARILTSAGPLTMMLLTTGTGATMSSGMLTDEAMTQLQKKVDSGEITSEEMQRRLTDPFGPYFLGFGIGLTEAAPFARLFQGRTGHWIKKIIEQGIEESGQETFQNTMENWIERRTWDPDRKLTDGMAESALLGGLLGAKAQVLFSGLEAGNNRRLGRAGELKFAVDYEGDQLDIYEVAQNYRKSGNETKGSAADQVVANFPLRGDNKEAWGRFVEENETALMRLGVNKEAIARAVAQAPDAQVEQSLEERAEQQVANAVLTEQLNQAEAQAEGDAVAGATATPSSARSPEEEEAARKKALDDFSIELTGKPLQYVDDTEIGDVAVAAKSREAPEAIADKGRPEKSRRSKQISLLSYVRQNKLRSDEGDTLQDELRSVLRDNRTPIPTLFRNDAGLSLTEAMEAAQAAGYAINAMGDQASETDFLNALVEEMNGGNALYPSGTEQDRMDQQETEIYQDHVTKYRAEIAEFDAETGLDFNSDLTDEDVALVGELMENGQDSSGNPIYDIGDAIEHVHNQQSDREVDHHAEDVKAARDAGDDIEIPGFEPIADARGPAGSGADGSSERQAVEASSFEEKWRSELESIRAYLRRDGTKVGRRDLDRALEDAGFSTDSWGDAREHLLSQGWLRPHGTGVRKGPTAVKATADAETEAQRYLPADLQKQLKSLRDDRERAFAIDLSSVALDRSRALSLIDDISKSRALKVDAVHRILRVAFNIDTRGKTRAQAINMAQMAMNERVVEFQQRTRRGINSPYALKTNLVVRERASKVVESFARNLRPEFQEIGLKVETAQRLTDSMVGNMQQTGTIGEVTEGGDILGVYTPTVSNQMIAISAAHGANTAVATIDHEIVHYLRDMGVLDPYWDDLAKLDHIRIPRETALRMIHNAFDRGLYRVGGDSDVRVTWPDRSSVEEKLYGDMVDRAGELTIREIYQINYWYSDLDADKQLEEVIAHAAGDWNIGNIDREGGEGFEFMANLFGAIGRSAKGAKDANGRALLDVDNIFRKVWTEAPEAIKRMNENRTEITGVRERYSRTSGQTPLHAVHQLSQDNLLFADSIGGLAVPSLAIMENTRSLNAGFGDITLIADPSLADPTINPVFTGDAWTTRFPEPDYKAVTAKKADQITSRIHPYEREAGEDGIVSEIYSGMRGQSANYNSPDKIIRKLFRSRVGQLWFARENGYTDPIPMEDGMRGYNAQFVKSPAWRKYLAQDTFAEDMNSYRRDTPEQEARWARMSLAAAEAIKEYYSDPMNLKEFTSVPTEEDVQALTKIGEDLLELVMEEYIDADGQLFMGKVLGDISRATNALGSQKINTTLLRESLETYLADKENEFLTFLDNEIRSLYAPPRIKIRGRLQPYNLENIVEVMTGPQRGKEDAVLHKPTPLLRALGTTQVNDLNWLRNVAESGELAIGMSEDQLKEKNDEMSVKFREFGYSIAPQWEYYNRDRFGSANDAASAMMDAFAKWIPNRLKRGNSGLAAAMRAEGFRLNASQVQEASDLAWELMETPVAYFEAKPQRGVRLSEFRGAVVPGDARPEVIDVLKKNGIPYRTYDRSGGREMQANAAVEFSREIDDLESRVSFSFAGPESPIADKSAFGLAKRMEENGFDRDKIWEATGFFKGLDGKWRWEIDDSKMELKPAAEEAFKRAEEQLFRTGKFDIDAISGRLDEMVDHPQLFMSSPRMASVRTYLKRRILGSSGTYRNQATRDFRPESMMAAGMDRSSLLSTLVHEIDHALASYYMLAAGSNPGAYDAAEMYQEAVDIMSDEVQRLMDMNPVAAERYRALNRAIVPLQNKYGEDWGQESTPEELDEINRLEEILLQDEDGEALSLVDWKRQSIPKPGDVQHWEKAAHDRYMGTYGEVMARISAKRRTMDADQRRATPPYQMYDTPEERITVEYYHPSHKGSSLSERPGPEEGLLPELPSFGRREMYVIRDARYHNRVPLPATRHIQPIRDLLGEFGLELSDRQTLGVIKEGLDTIKEVLDSDLGVTQQVQAINSVAQEFGGISPLEETQDAIDRLRDYVDSIQPETIEDIAARHAQADRLRERSPRASGRTGRHLTEGRPYYFTDNELKATQATLEADGDVRSFAVTLDATPDQILDLSEEVGSMPATIQQAISAIRGLPLESIQNSEMTGEHMWTEMLAIQDGLTPGLAPVSLANRLRSFGVRVVAHNIDGVVGLGVASNYVVIDPDAIQILDSDGDVASDQDRRAIIEAATQSEESLTQADVMFSRSGLDMSREARYERASQMGFDTSEIWYRGDRERFDEFKTNVPTKRYVLFSEFDVKSQGVFFTSSRDDAASYGPNVGEYFVRKKKTLVPPRNIAVSSRDRESLMRHTEMAADFRYIFEPLMSEDVNGNLSIDVDGGVSTADVGQDTGWNDVIDWAWLDDPDVIARMRERGYDSAEVHEPNDESGESLFIIDPSNVRSIDAAFDPAQDGSAKLMFSRAGGVDMFRSTLDDVLSMLNPKDTVTLKTLQQNGVRKSEIESRLPGVDTSKGMNVGELQRVAAENPIEMLEKRYDGVEDNTDLRVLETEVNEDGNEVLTYEDRDTGRMYYMTVDADAGNVYLQDHDGTPIPVSRPLNNQNELGAEDDLNAYIRNQKVEDRGVDGYARWSDWSIDPDNPTYRETVVHLPDGEQSQEFKTITEERVALQSRVLGEEISDGVTVQDRLDQIDSRREELRNGYRSSHWDEPNVLFHIRTSQHLIGRVNEYGDVEVNGDNAFLLDELQSDWGQAIRTQGEVTPEDRARLEASEANLNEFKERMETSTQSGRRMILEAMESDENTRRRIGPAKSRYGEDLSEMPDMMVMNVLQDMVGGIGTRFKFSDASYDTIIAAMDFLEQADGVEAEDNYGFNNESDYLEIAIDRGFKPDLPEGVESAADLPVWNETPNRIARSWDDMRQASTNLRLATSEYNQLRQNLGIDGDETPSNPLVNDTKTWVTMGLRKTILEAVSDFSNEGIAITPGHIIADRFRDDNPDGKIYAYDKMYPKMLLKELKRLDPSASYSTVRLMRHDGDVIESSADPVGSIADMYEQTNFHYFPITSRMRERVRDEGLPMFSRAGGGSSTPNYSTLSAQQLTKLYKRTEDELKKAGKSPAEIAKSMSKTFGVEITESEIKSGKTWWRLMDSVDNDIRYNSTEYDGAYMDNRETFHWTEMYSPDNFETSDTERATFEADVDKIRQKNLAKGPEARRGTSYLSDQKLVEFMSNLVTEKGYGAKRIVQEVEKAFGIKISRGHMSKMLNSLFPKRKSKADNITPPHLSRGERSIRRELTRKYGLLINAEPIRKAAEAHPEFSTELMRQHIKDVVGITLSRGSAQNLMERVHGKGRKPTKMTRLGKTIDRKTARTNRRYQMDDRTLQRESYAVQIESLAKKGYSYEVIGAILQNWRDLPQPMTATQVREKLRAGKQNRTRPNVGARDPKSLKAMLNRVDMQFLDARIAAEGIMNYIDSDMTLEEVAEQTFQDTGIDVEFDVYAELVEAIREHVNHRGISKAARAMHQQIQDRFDGNYRQSDLGRAADLQPSVAVSGAEGVNASSGRSEQSFNPAEGEPTAYRSDPEVSTYGGGGGEGRALARESTIPDADGGIDKIASSQDLSGSPVLPNADNPGGLDRVKNRTRYSRTANSAFAGQRGGYGAVGLSRVNGPRAESLASRGLYGVRVDRAHSGLNRARFYLFDLDVVNDIDPMRSSTEAEFDMDRADEWAATIALKFHMEPGGRIGWEIDNVHVKEQHRGKGLGREIYDLVEEELDTTIDPSGILSPMGYQFWQGRNKDAVSYHSQVPDGKYKSMWVSPAFLERAAQSEIDVLQDQTGLYEQEDRDNAIAELQIYKPMLDLQVDVRRNRTLINAMFSRSGYSQEGALRKLEHDNDIDYGRTRDTTEFGARSNEAGATDSEGQQTAVSTLGDSPIPKRATEDVGDIGRVWLEDKQVFWYEKTELGEDRRRVMMVFDLEYDLILPETSGYADIFEEDGKRAQWQARGVLRERDGTWSMEIADSRGGKLGGRRAVEALHEAAEQALGQRLHPPSSMGFRQYEYWSERNPDLVKNYAKFGKRYESPKQQRQIIEMMKESLDDPGISTRVKDRIRSELDERQKEFNKLPDYVQDFSSRSRFSRLGGTNQAPNFRPGVDDAGTGQETTALREIIEQLTFAVNMPLETGRLDREASILYGMAGAGPMRGQYDRQQGVARTRHINDIYDVARRAAYHLEETTDDLMDLTNAHAGELEAMAQRAGLAENPLREGFSEFFAQYLLTPDGVFARNEAPVFFDAFEQWLEVQPRLLQARLEATREAYVEYQTTSPAQRVAADLVVTVKSPNYFTRIWEQAALDVGRLDPQGEGRTWGTLAAATLWSMSRLSADFYRMAVSKNFAGHQLGRYILTAIENQTSDYRTLSPAERMSNRMRDVNMNDQDLSRASGIERSTILAYMNGQQTPSGEDAEAIGAALGRTRAWVVSGRNRTDFTPEKDLWWTMKSSSNIRTWVEDAIKNGFQARNANPNGEKPRLGPGYLDVMNAVMQRPNGDSSFSEETLREFDAFLVARRARVLYRRWRNGQLERIPVAESEAAIHNAYAELEARNPQFAQAAAVYDQFNQAWLDYALEWELITSEQHDVLSREEDYAPFMRKMTQNDIEDARRSMAGGSNRTPLLRRLTGSRRDILSPTQITLQRIQNIVQRSYQQQLALTLEGFTHDVDDLGGLIERIPATETRVTQLNAVETLRSITRAAGEDLDSVQSVMAGLAQASGPLQDPNAVSVMAFQQQPAREREGETLMAYFRNGEMQMLSIKNTATHPHLAKDIMQNYMTAGSESMPFWIEVMRNLANIRRSTVTLWMGFVWRNLIQDPFVHWTLNRHIMLPGQTHARGAIEIARQYASGQGSWFNPAERLRTGTNPMYADYISREGQGGILGGNMTNSQRQGLNEGDLGALVGDRDNVGWFASLRHFWRNLGMVSEISETAGRLGLFALTMDRAMRHGMTKAEAIKEAGFVSTDIMNYGESGLLTEHPKAVMPFFNAGIVGMDKSVRVATSHSQHGNAFRNYMRMWAETGSTGQAWDSLSGNERNAILDMRATLIKSIFVFGSLEIALLMMFDDDDRYNNVSDDIKDTHIIIPLGRVPGLTVDNVPEEWHGFIQNHVLRLPIKPFELAMPANIARIAIDSLSRGENTGTMVSRMASSAARSFTPPISFPFLEDYLALHWANRDPWSGYEIISRWDKEKLPEEQYSAYTSYWGREVGSILKTSPKAVEWYTKSILGPYGRELLHFSNMFDPNRPAVNLRGAAPFSGLNRFLLHSPRMNASDAMDRTMNPSLEGNLNQIVRIMGGHVQSYNGSRNRYKLLIKGNKTYQGGQLNEARQLLNQMTKPEQAYSILDVHWTGTKLSGHKRMHPLIRNEKLQSTFFEINRLVLTNQLQSRENTLKSNLKRQNRKPAIQLPAVERRNAQDMLRHIQLIELQNTLILMKAPGYQYQPIKDVQPMYDELRYISPTIYEELQSRLDHGKVLPFRAIQSVWPSIKAKLESEKVQTFVTSREIPRVDSILGKEYRTARRMAREVERSSKARVQQIRGRKPNGAAAQ